MEKVKEAQRLRREGGLVRRGGEPPDTVIHLVPRVRKVEPLSDAEVRDLRRMLANARIILSACPVARNALREANE